MTSKSPASRPVKNAGRPRRGQAAPAAPDDYRLPATLTAKGYSIALRVHLDRSDFAGRLRFVGSLAKACDRLIFHGRGLDIERVEVRAGGRPVPAKAVLRAAEERILLKLEGAVAAGEVTVEFFYRAQLAKSMHGLYLAKDGPEVALVSQCEASDARAIFPCLDEPDKKATLKWTILTDPHVTVLTNGPLQKAEPLRGQGLVVHRFAATAPMSTYLAALTVGNFEAGAEKKVAGVPCRIYSGRNKGAQTAFAMEVTEKILPHYEAYFGQKYAYHKLDQVAVPGFDAGAMENSGAIFYRQSLLLMEAGKVSFAAQKRIGEVIAHEIAHQWFGNLVTMQWWDDLWLNEAFATWMAFSSCNKLYPDWHIWHDYLEAKEGALVADALGSTHPIYAEVKTPAEATELFDVITYEKGCGVLRMAEGFLGEEKFRAGIRRYMAEHRFGNARGMDLWHALGRAAQLPVAELMQSWITQSGFPLLTCSRRGERTFTLTQQPFAAAARKKAPPASWLVPVVWLYEDKDGVHQHRMLLTGDSHTVVLPGRGKVLWAYPNHEGMGFWRTQLVGSLQQDVLGAGSKKLGTAASMAMIYDAWALFRDDRTDIEALMEVLCTFAGSASAPVFRAVAGRLRALWTHVAAEQDRDALGRFMETLARPHLDRLGWQPKAKETPHDATLRASVIDLLGHYARAPDVLSQANKLQQQEMQDPTAVDANLAATVVVLSAVTGDAAHLGRLVHTYLARKKSGATPDVQGRYLAALCAFSSPARIREVLALLLDGTIPQEQLRSVLGSLLGHPVAGPLAWRFLRQHWQVLTPQVGAMGIARLVEATGALPWAMRDELQAFFAAHPIAEAERAVRKSAETMAIWHRLRARSAAPLAQFVRARLGA